MSVTTMLVPLLAGYLLGSIVPGVLFVRLKRGEDIRRLGSGNVGATNVRRILGLPFALLTFAWDAFKGFLAFRLAHSLGMTPPLSIASGFAAFMGHLYPCFFHFRGGKGVATAFGILLAFDPWLARAALAVWGITLLLWRVAGAASLAAAATLPLLILCRSPHEPIPLLFALLLTFFIFRRHEGNLAKLLASS